MVNNLYRTATLAAALALGGPAYAGNLVKPVYPPGMREKPLVVNVVATAPLGAGRVAAVEIIYADGAPPFAAAAAAALEASAFDADRADVTAWYKFKLMQDTEVHDISPGRQELEKQPALVTYAPPQFPPGAPSLKTEVTLELLVGDDGAVWYARAPGDGADALYVEQALAAARQFKFEAATADGKAIAAWYPFVIEFK